MAKQARESYLMLDCASAFSGCSIRSEAASSGFSPSNAPLDGLLVVNYRVQKLKKKAYIFTRNGISNSVTRQNENSFPSIVISGDGV